MLLIWMEDFELEGIPMLVDMGRAGEVITVYPRWSKAKDVAAFCTATSPIMQNLQSELVLQGELWLLMVLNCGPLYYSRFNRKWYSSKIGIRLFSGVILLCKTQIKCPWSVDALFMEWSGWIGPIWVALSDWSSWSGLAGVILVE